jgi:hypothetical protein
MRGYTPRSLSRLEAYTWGYPVCRVPTITRWVKWWRIQPPMGLRSGGDSVAAAGSCGGGVVLEAPLEGGGGGSGHTANPVSSESPSRPPLLRSVTLGLRRIRVVCLYIGFLGGDLGTGMTSTSSSSSSSSAMATSTTPMTAATPSSPIPQTQ